ncbi:MAG: pseudaminic acid cytidylyltransferase [Candidatus Acinetobacter avistercoris]|nr:pseudaminic acid cytidylyltransferase [Candidatus Acinetobacter avistercoris]
MKVAIIPARGGSKRIPRKNIKEFCGKPMIAWSIEAALNSGCFDKVIVSTDDDETIEIANNFGAETPFKRPVELADDYTPTIPVVQHAIANISLQNIQYVCCIYPTAAFITGSILKESLLHLKNGETDFVMPVIAYPCSFERALQINKNGLLRMNNISNINKRTQDCNTLYHDAGQFYFGTINAWLHPGNFYDKRVKAIKIPKYRAHDIDTPDDWDLAEIVFSQLERF